MARRIVALATLAAAASGLAFSYLLNDSTGLPIKWPAGTIAVRLLLGNTANLDDGSSFNQSARTAALSWNAVIGAAQFQTDTGTGAAADRNGVNEMAFSRTVFGRDFGNNVLAITTTWAIGNERTEGDILFNTANFSWDSYRGDRRTSVVDLQRVALHELGHLLGLDHPDENGQRVDAVMNSIIGDRYQLSEDDIEGARSLYGPPGRPPNDNFADAIAIVFGTNGAFTTKGYNTNATKESGEPSHANDGGDTPDPNPGGRSVWWSWAAPSSASVTIDTRGSTFDTILGVYTGSSLPSLTRVASNDDVDPGVVQASTVTFDATSGTVYRIAVDGFNNRDDNGADNGGLTLNLNFSGSTGSPPIITKQPASVARNVGEAATFSVAASGTGPLSYQWTFNGNPVSGATESTFSIPSVATASAGTYSCVVTNPFGSTSSNAVTLTINTPRPPAPPPSSGGGGGGGGAPSLWFVAVLAAVSAARLLRGRRRADMRRDGRAGCHGGAGMRLP